MNMRRTTFLKLNTPEEITHFTKRMGFAANDTFKKMPYKHFCEYYKISRDAPRPKQRLQRWERLDGQSYIKERRQPQVISKSPRMKADPSNFEYCFSEIFLKCPWRQLLELPSSDEDCINVFGRLSSTNGMIGDALQEDITRAMQLDLLSERASGVAGFNLPASQWTLNDALEYEYSASGPVDERQEGGENHFASKHQYSPDDIAQAETFITNEVKPFVKEFRASLQASGNVSQPKKYHYPVDRESKALNDDQWVPFAICMKQSRQRYSSLLSGIRCSPMRMIINGEGGTDNARRVLLMAHQGTAAFNIGGETICSALGLGTLQTGGFNREYVPLASTRTGFQSYDGFKDVHLIIFDEYSVISCGMLHWINERLKEIFPCNQASEFGGYDVVFVGDPAQLGPVAPFALSTPAGKLTSKPQQKGRQLWEEIDRVCQLTSQNRGQNDPEWFNALHRLRDMNTLPQDFRLFNSGNIRKEAWPEWTKHAIHIAYRNEDVDRSNEECLRRQTEPILRIEARHQILYSKNCENQLVDANVATHLLEEAVQPNYSRDKEIRSVLNVAVGVPVTLTVNLAQTAGLCNGTRRLIYDFMFKTGDNIPIVLVQITSKYMGPSFFKNVPNVVPIPARTIAWGRRNAVMKTRRTGLPLRLAYAMTVHKVQGLTCDWLVFDPTNLPSSTFAYVGLSRVRQRQNIVLSSPILLKLTTGQSEKQILLEAENSRVKILARRCRQKAEAVIQDMQSVARNHNSALLPRKSDTYIDISCFV